MVAYEYASSNDVEILARDTVAAFELHTGGF